jgi:hypothetical protein
MGQRLDERERRRRALEGISDLGVIEIWELRR